MNEIEIPEADRQIGTNHPRHTRIIYGHNSPQLDFLDAYILAFGSPPPNGDATVAIPPALVISPNISCIFIIVFI